MRARICTPVAAERTFEAISLIKRAEFLGADLVEIRLDYLHDLRELDKIVKATSLPLIATNRQHEQGGYRRQSEGQRVQILLDAVKLGFRYVDLELTTANLKPTVGKLKEIGVGVIVSFHDFKQTPSLAELEKVMRSQVEVGADVCKLVTTANETADNIKCLLLTWNMSRAAKVVCFAMGERGVLSRAFSPFFGAYFTYASIEERRETAPGQLSIVDLKRLYKDLGVED